jgi:hypothetical protein
MQELTDLQRAELKAFQDVIYETIRELEATRDKFPGPYYTRFQRIIKSLDKAYEGLEVIETN